MKKRLCKLSTLPGSMVRRPETGSSVELVNCMYDWKAAVGSSNNEVPTSTIPGVLLTSEIWAVSAPYLKKIM